MPSLKACPPPPFSFLPFPPLAERADALAPALEPGDAAVHAGRGPGPRRGAAPGALPRPGPGAPRRRPRPPRRRSGEGLYGRVHEVVGLESSLLGKGVVVSFLAARGPTETECVPARIHRVGAAGHWQQLSRGEQVKHRKGFQSRAKHVSVEYFPPIRARRARDAIS